MSEIKKASLKLLKVVTTEIRIKQSLSEADNFARVRINRRLLHTYEGGFEVALSAEFEPRYAETSQSEFFIEVSALFAHPTEIEESVLLNHIVLGSFYMLFPYVRSNVSLYLNLSGTQPYLLPPITLYGAPTEERRNFESYTLELTQSNQQTPSSPE